MKKDYNSSLAQQNGQHYGEADGKKRERRGGCANGAMKPRFTCSEARIEAPPIPMATFRQPGARSKAVHQPQRSAARRLIRRQVLRQRPGLTRAKCASPGLRVA